MSSSIYTQHHADGTSRLVRRSTPQGRKPSGLSKPQLVRLYEVDREKLDALKERLGYLYNENEIIRSAVHKYVESIYIELLTH